MAQINREELVATALRIRERAYAPYSGFQVGAAVQTQNGEIFAGCNVENASYGLTICAERAAVFQAVAAGRRDILAIAIAASGKAAPCGACRQVLAEFGDDIVVLMTDTDSPGQTVELSLHGLLPHRFTFSKK